MIFALIDLVHYKSRTGRFTNEALESAGMRMATDANLEDAHFQPGDILFVHARNSVKSWVTMYFQWSPINHMAMLVSNDEIMDVTPKGIRRERLQRYGGENYYFSKGDPTRRVPNFDRQAAVAFVESQTQGRYDWFTIFKLGYKIMSGVHPDYPGNWRMWADVCFVLSLSRRRKVLIFCFLFILAGDHFGVQRVEWPYPGFRLTRIGVVHPISGKQHIVYQRQTMPEAVKKTVRESWPRTIAD